MKGKGGLVVGMAVGYVLGTRSGRAKYEQMKGWAAGRWNDPKVQAKVSDVEHTVKETVKQKAPEVQHKLVDAGKHAVAAARPGHGSSKGESTPPDTMNGRTDGYRDQAGGI